MDGSSKDTQESFAYAVQALALAVVIAAAVALSRSCHLTAENSHNQGDQLAFAHA